MKRSVCLFIAALALAGCAREPLESAVDPRVAREVAAVRLDAELTAMAQHQADEMAAHGELSNNVAGPFATRLVQAQVAAEEAGENLGAGYYSLSDAMAGWKGSAEHNANMLRPDFTRIGVAIAKNAHSHWGVFWAMEFAGEPMTALR